MNNSSNTKPPVPIDKHHILDDFDCGVPELYKYLKSYSYQNHQSRGARTYVITLDNKVIGYYSLAYGSVETNEVPPRVRKDLGRYPVPVMILARLAVDRSQRGKGLGWGLVRDALSRTLQAADIAGLRAVLVYAKDERDKAFCRKFDFASSLLDNFYLYLLVKDFRKTLQALS